MALAATLAVVAGGCSGSSGSSAPKRAPTADSIGGLTLHLDAGAEHTTSGLVQIALDAPEGSTEAQVSVDPTFAGAGWQAIDSVAPLQLTDGGQQLVFARVRSGDGAPGQSVVATIDYDATWDAATASAKDGSRHRASWAGLVAPDVLQIRVEDGRVIQQGAPPHDQLIGKALTAWPLDVADQYQLDGAAVTSVSRISRPLGVAHLAGGETSPLVHDLFLRLAAPLSLGQDHVVRFPGDEIDDLTFRIDPTSTRSSAVHVNQVGFAPGDDAKQAMVSTWTGAAGGVAYGGELDFEVVDATTAAVVLSGKTTSRTLSGSGEFGKGDLTGAEVHVADFSQLQQPGRYRVCVPTIGCSYDFAIDPLSTWRRAANTVARGLYHQRSGIALEEPYTALVRPAAFPEGTEFHQTDLTMIDDPSNVGQDDRFAEYPEHDTGALVEGAWGGHFDAGDWNSRIQHLDDLRIALDLVRLYPDAWSDINIPESGDRVPDLIDEGLWDLDQFRRLQTAEGGVPGNIDQARFGTGTETSWDNDIKVYVFAPDVWSTYIYAGVAAETAVVLRQYDGARADVYAESAARAMSWAESQWVGITGDKRDQLAPSVDPQRATAAAAMLMLTSDDHWNDVFAEASTFDEQPADLVDCPGGTCDAAWVYASVDPSLSRPAVRANAVESLKRTADAALNGQASTLFAWLMERPDIPMVWGLGPSSPQAIGVLRAFVLTGDERYRTAAVQAASFSLGNNPLGQSFITGLGANPPRFPLLVDSVNGGQPIFPGTAEFGIHDLTFSTDDDWVNGLLQAAGTVPDPGKVPTLWSWYDMSSLPMMNEFTVHRSDGAALWTFGVLAGSAASTP